MERIIEIGERLKLERERLDLSQTQFGAVGGVTKQAQIRYEKGERKPDVLYLIEISKLGIDIDYILFGTNGQGETLNMNEKKLLDGYRKLDTDKQKWLLSFLINGIELAPKQNDNQCRGGDDKPSLNQHNTQTGNNNFSFNSGRDTRF